VNEEIEAVVDTTYCKVFVDGNLQLLFSVASQINFDVSLFSDLPFQTPELCKQTHTLGGSSMIEYKLVGAQLPVGVVYLLETNK